MARTVGHGNEERQGYLCVCSGLLDNQKSEKPARNWRIPEPTNLAGRDLLFFFVQWPDRARLMNIKF